MAKPVLVAGCSGAEFGLAPLDQRIHGVLRAQAQPQRREREWADLSDWGDAEPSREMAAALHLRGNWLTTAHDFLDSVEVEHGLRVRLAAPRPAGETVAAYLERGGVVRRCPPGRAQQHTFWAIKPIDT